jgi:hypothetical protein
MTPRFSSAGNFKMQSSLKIRPYRAIIEREGGAAYDTLLRDLCRCASECGWAEGVLALYGTSGDTPLLLIHFREGAVRLLPWQSVALALLAGGTDHDRLLVKGWPHGAPPEPGPVAGWEWVLTRVLPAADEEALADCSAAAPKENEDANTAGR